MKNILLSYLFLSLSTTLIAQKANRIVYEQCGTMQRLQAKFKNNPALQKQFEDQRAQFYKAFKEGSLQSSRIPGNAKASRTVYSIPIVFHIVMTNPNIVTDRQVGAQLDTLNKDFMGMNGDSSRIPSYFKSIFGKSSIQFCLAQQTPGGESTTGIDRITTTKSSFSADDAVKHASSSGADIWNNEKYFNVWICALSDNLLGYSTFPNDGIPNEQGVVIDYHSLPGGSLQNYNSGKTLTHETGHYFNLFHIWGDDDGACTGTDDVDDTPNQANSSSTCYSGIKTDDCTTSGNGIMYENYMDYTPDACLVMFTTEQVQRMENAFLLYRSSLLNSNGCQPPVLKNYDAELTTINEPLQRVCSNAFSPEVTIKNNGIEILTSLTVSARIDNGTLSSYTWTGSLARSESAVVNLSSLSTDTGKHTLTVYVANPDNHPDEDITSDTLSSVYQYFIPVKNISESFEESIFPPRGWDIVNPDGSFTWQQVATVAKNGNASVMINNFDYNAIGQKDDLQLPEITLGGVDSAYLSFDVAATTYTNLNVLGNVWDTLEVLASTDCGQTYKSLYKKWGADLVTRTAATTNAFAPLSTEWRKDSVNLINYTGLNNLMLAFRNTNGHENNIYLDDINLRTVTVNPNLKSLGFLVSPNPSSGVFAVQFYPQPANLEAIQVFNFSGQKIEEIIINGQANSYYNIDISHFNAGAYVVRAVFKDKVLIKKIVKL